MKRKIMIMLVSLTLAPLLVSGCGVDTSRLTSDPVVPLEQASLADAAGHALVGIGEATHGNKEFVETRKLIIQRLVQDHGFRTVALEADFGGTARANDYVLHDQGTAEEAATALGFDIYKTRETADLIKWIHDHNAEVGARDQVRLYGFDMQRYDHNKARLLAFLRTVDPDQVAPAEEALAGLTDATRAEAGETVINNGIRAAQQLVKRLQANEAAYVKGSSATDYAVALHHAETIVMGAQLQTSGSDYAQKRDGWMAQNVQWIRKFEAGQDRNKMIIAGHNGHIDKSGAAFAFPSMGQQLAEAYGPEYFTIGTDFGENTFISKDASSGERQTYTLDLKSPLAKLFGDEALGYVNIAEASEQPGNREVLESKIKMGSVGDSFRSIYRLASFTHTVKMVPAESYDALVFVPHATPVTPL